MRWRCTQKGVRCRNANIDFGARRNDPAARFQHVTRVFLLDALTNSVAQSLSAPAVALPRTLIDLAIDFERTSNMLVRARDRNDTMAVKFYEAIRQHYISERVSLETSNVQRNE